MEMPGTVPLFTILQSREHGFGVSMDQVVADGVERSDESLRTKAWLREGSLHVLHSPKDGFGNGVETSYEVDDGLLVVRRSALELSAPNTFIQDDLLSFAQSFERCPAQDAEVAAEPSTPSAPRAPAPEPSAPSAPSKPRPPCAVQKAPCAPKMATPEGEGYRVPTPPLMPCAPAGPPGRQPVARRRFRQVA